MDLLYENELTTKVLFGRIKKQIKEEQINEVVGSLDNFNKIRRNIITKCDMTLGKYSSINSNKHK